MVSSTSSDGIDATVLRSAVEFVLMVVREGQKAKPPLEAPAVLRRLARSNPSRPNVVTPAVCEAVRRTVESDPPFRERIASVATSESVDELGLVWLRRPTGWEDEIRRLAAEVAEAEAQQDAVRRLKSAERRRVAAEEHRARAVAEAVVLREALDEWTRRAEAAEREAERLDTELAEVRAQLTASHLEIRHASDREQAARRRLDEAMRERVAADDEAERARDARDDALVDRARSVADRSELAAIAARAAELAARLSTLLGPEVSEDRSEPPRTPLGIPGGFAGDGAATAEFLLRSGVEVLVDGYNVAKSAWPDRDLAAQRSALLDECENLARRFGRSHLTVVFDGASVIGATGAGRRMIRVVFSPEGTEADDVIRHEVSLVPASRAVVVVTDDAAIVRDVRAAGANHVSAEAFVSVFA